MNTLLEALKTLNEEVERVFKIKCFFDRDERQEWNDMIQWVKKNGCNIIQACPTSQEGRRGHEISLYVVFFELPEDKVMDFCDYFDCDPSYLRKDGITQFKTMEMTEDLNQRAVRYQGQALDEGEEIFLVTYDESSDSDWWENYHQDTEAAEEALTDALEDDPEAKLMIVSY